MNLVEVKGLDIEGLGIHRDLEGVGTKESPQRVGHVMGAGTYGSGAVFLELAS
ncbi:unnamed protein product [marine sediment metagenome]|uniref:Uncharacterized protein n=1 Tax=marine sediment metagenome TaxID=412755 RepID=X1PUS4_9ZZZZ